MTRPASVTAWRIPSQRSCSACTRVSQPPILRVLPDSQTPVRCFSRCRPSWAPPWPAQSECPQGHVGPAARSAVDPQDNALAQTGNGTRRGTGRGPFIRRSEKFSGLALRRHGGRAHKLDRDGGEGLGTVGGQLSLLGRYAAWDGELCLVVSLRAPGSPSNTWFKSCSKAASGRFFRKIV